MILPGIRLLAARMKTLWKREKNARPAFAGAARQALEDSRLHETDLVGDVREWLARTPGLPRGQEGVAVLGQPAVLLYRNESFLIGLNHRISHVSDIHHHRAPLAYQVIRGIGLYVDYEFEDKEKCGRELYVGTLRMIRATLRRAGEAEAIPAGYRPIHQVANISRPQVTLVIKAVRMGRFESLRYLRSGVALSRDVIRSDSQHQRAELMMHLCQQGLEPAKDFLQSCLSHLPEGEAFHVALEYYYASGDGEGLSEVVPKSRWRSSRAVLRLLEGVRQKTIASEPGEIGVNLDGVRDEGSRLLALLASMVPDPGVRRTLAAQWSRDRLPRRERGPLQEKAGTRR